MSEKVAKIPTLERSLKIKSIELNSIKHNKAIENDELNHLKDEEIEALKAEQESLKGQLLNNEELREKVGALQEELELIEEEKFNIESISNERVFVIEELHEENRKLTEEITTIGERNGQLERTI